MGRRDETLCGGQLATDCLCFGGFRAIELFRGELAGAKRGGLEQFRTLAVGILGIDWRRSR
jgi:hypothetical protein